MKILNNIVANCSDFVWSLDEPKIEDIRVALKAIEKATGWGLYACPERFDYGIFIPVQPEEVEIVEYQEEGDDSEGRTELGVPIDKIPICKKYLSKIDKSGTPFISEMMVNKTSKQQFIPVVFARIGHIPNDDGVHFFKDRVYGVIPTLRVSYSCGYCGLKLSISENQPQVRELGFFGEVLRNVGGTFHHEDGGYAQIEYHQEWFEENGYEDVLDKELN